MSWNIRIKDEKEPLQLAVQGKEEWEETAHAVDSYKVENQQKCAEYQSQKDGCRSLFVKRCLKKS